MKQIRSIRMSMTVLMCLAMSIGIVTSAFAGKTAKPIELSFSHSVPSTVPIAEAYRRFGEHITEKSGGRIEVVFYWAESLLKSTETFRGGQTRVADIGYDAFGHDQGLMPLNEIFTLPFLGYPSPQKANEIYKTRCSSF